MLLQSNQVKIDHLHQHLQYAVDLELWTIPFYMSAMYSIKDKTTEQYQLIRTVVNQEMLHLQCAANVCNAFGLSPQITVPQYEGQTVPHLDFGKDNPDVVKEYEPYTAEIGPLDLQHINAMCLIELPDYLATQNDDVLLFDNVNEYGTIGEFYQALLKLITLHKKEIVGGVNQVDFFAPFYRNMPNLIIDKSGESGYSQVELLIHLITDQGEGISSVEGVLSVFQNTADDIRPELDHFDKFKLIKDGNLPQVFSTKSPDSYDENDKQLQQILEDNFYQLTQSLEALFAGKSSDKFFPCMAMVGGAIRNCWQNGVTPQYGSNGKCKETNNV